MEQHIPALPWAAEDNSHTANGQGKPQALFVSAAPSIPAQTDQMALQEHRHGNITRDRLFAAHWKGADCIR